MCEKEAVEGISGELRFLAGSSDHSEGDNANRKELVNALLDVHRAYGEFKVVE